MNISRCPLKHSEAEKYPKHKYDSWAQSQYLYSNAILRLMFKTVCNLICNAIRHFPSHRFTIREWWMFLTIYKFNFPCWLLLFLAASWKCFQQWGIRSLLNSLQGNVCETVEERCLWDLASQFNSETLTTCRDANLNSTSFMV